MPREALPPTIEVVDRFGQNFERFSHPAYAQIGASRVQGGQTSLYGSDFLHNGYVALRIAASTLERDLSRDWLHGGKQIIEVAMSESQWATLLSSLNLGDGVPCTIQSLNGAIVPAIPPRNEDDAFKNDMRHRVQKPIASLRKLKTDLEQNLAGLNPKKVANLLASVDQALNELASNLPFVADSFDTHVEIKIEKAKQDLHGYMNGVLTRAGLAQLSANTPIETIESKHISGPTTSGDSQDPHND